MRKGRLREPPLKLRPYAFLAFAFDLCFALQQSALPSWFFASCFAFISHESPQHAGWSAWFFMSHEPFLQQQPSFASAFVAPPSFMGHDPPLQQHESIEQQASAFFCCSP